MTGPIAAAARWFDLSREDVRALAAASRHACEDLAVRTWVRAGAERLESALGRPSEQPVVAAAVTSPPPGSSPQLADQLALLVFAVALPRALTFMRERDIDEQVIGATFADVGRTVRKNRTWFGRSGLEPELSTWLVRHLHGAIYQLGRLQFERAQLDATTASFINEAGAAAQCGEPVLSLHIPDGLGPLTPAACDESMSRAARFFRRHFGDDNPRYAVCVSWLLDRQLEVYLAPASNILAFQRRFTIRAAPDDQAGADRAVRQFVFGEASTPRQHQPRRTSLQRAVHQHLESGRHFQTAHGWFPWTGRNA